MKARIPLIVITVLLAASCSQDVAPENKPDLRALTAGETQISGSNDAFAFDFYRQVMKGKSGNTILSPLSVGMALGMTLNGAEGETKEGILKTIDYSGMTVSDVNEGYRGLSDLLLSMDKKIQLNIANSVWYEKSLTVNPDFAGVIKSGYAGQVAGLDFLDSNSKDVINEWVSDNTAHKINDLVDGTQGYVMLIINAIYFKGEWVSQFDKSKTKADTFYKPDGSSVQTSTMYCDNATIRYTSSAEAELIDIPYGNGQFSMTVLMPKTGNTVSDLVDQLTDAKFTEYLSNANTTSAALQMPKFSFGWKSQLNRVLSGMGMADAFTDEANLPNIFQGSPKLAISDVIHQATIETNEEGSTAAAATKVGITLTSASPEPIPILINRAFLFMIRENHSNVILFIGQVDDPSIN